MFPSPAPEAVMRRWIAPVLRTLAARSRPTARPARLSLTEMERRDLLTVFVGFQAGTQGERI